MVSKTRFAKIQLLGLLFISVAWLKSAAAQDVVGVLSQAVQPNVAAQLQLTDEQIEDLKKVIADRQTEALSLAQQLRELPPEERDSKVRNFAKESESRGYKILDLQQRTMLQRMKLAKGGLATLSDMEVAQTIGLSEGQRKQVDEVLAERTKLNRELGEEKAKSELDLRLKAVLTATQYMAWQTMAGVTNKVATQPIPNSNAYATTDAQSTETAASETMSQEGATTDLGNRANVEGAGSVSRQNEVQQRIDGEPPLALNFNKLPWEDVLKWMAKEAELSLQTDLFPPGTFTYRDPYRTYSIGQAMDLMNRALLRQGYALLRNQRTLMVLDLSSGDNADVVRELIRELAELVTPEELDHRGDYELLKCLFILTRLDVAEAEKDIKLLLGPQGSAVSMPSASQILVCENSSKLRIIRDMLERSESPEKARGASIVSIRLQHVTAEEILGIARPLLGLTTENNVSEKISISTDAFGNTIFATGSVDNIQKLQDIVKKVDVAPDAATASSATVEQPEVRMHAIPTGDPKLIYSVIETLMAGMPNVRMALDEKTNSVVAQATPSDHKIIEDTVKRLTGSQTQFRVIQLKRLDAQAALLTLEKFFGKKSSESDSKGPTFSADTLARTVMVQGTEQQVQQVEDLLNKLEESGPSMGSLGDSVKVFQIPSRSQDRVLGQIEQLWQSTKRTNRIRIVSPSGSEGAGLTQRSVHNLNEPDSKPVEPAVKGDGSEKPTETPAESTESSPKVNDSAAEEVNPKTTMTRRPSVKYVSFQPPGSENAEESKPDSTGEKKRVLGDDIVILKGPTGLIVSSDDPEALAEFEQIARMLSDQMALSGSEPTIFFLRYVKAQAASELLQGILSGESSGGGGGGLFGNLAGNVLGGLGGGLVGGLLGGGGSSTSSAGSSEGIASGEVTITPDPRLNSLIVQANPLDLELIEQLLKVIDQENGPLDVETQGKTHIIQVNNANVEDVAKVVREVFADRIGGAQGAGAQRQPSPQEFIAALRGAAGGGGRGQRGGQSELKEATMTVGTEAKTNSLIVKAPAPLFEEVKKLVDMLDQSSADQGESVVSIPLQGGINPAVVRSALQSVFGQQVRTNQTTNNTNNAQGRGQQRTGGQGFPGGGGGFPGGGGGFPGAGGGFPGGGGGFPGAGGGGFQGIPGGFQGFGGGNRAGGGGGGQGNRGGGAAQGTRGGGAGGRGGR